jgi:hypothetical protein
LRSLHEGYPGRPISMPTPDRFVRKIAGRENAAGRCTDGGHDWDDWYALTSSPEIQFRYCDRTGCSASQERPLRQTTGRHYLALRNQRRGVDHHGKPNYSRPSEQGGPK